MTTDNCPLVSVIMATYEGDEPSLLREAIDSIRCQTYPAVEVVVVIDGPVPAERLEMLRSYEVDDDFRVVSLPESLGPGGARNRGIRVAKGQFVAIADADDISYCTRLEKQWKFLDRGDYDVVGAQLDVIDAAGMRIGRRAVPTSAEAIRRAAPFRCPMNNPAIFARRSVLLEPGYIEEYEVGEDYALWVELLRRGRRLANLPDAVGAYRQGAYSIDRRRGARYALIDCRIKLTALSLAPAYLRPIAVVMAFGAALGRCLPRRAFGPGYEVWQRLSGKLQSTAAGIGEGPWWEDRRKMSDDGQ